MELFVFLLELVGTLSFAVSGATLALKKDMDLFGVCAMGLITACGGGALRDLMLGCIPPAMFRRPVYALTAIVCSAVIFLPAVRRRLMGRPRIYDLLMLLSDSLGLGIFTAVGAAAVLQAGYGDNLFFVVFLGVITGVGGGVLRDVLAGMRPYIFVKHIYACAAIGGGLLFVLVQPVFGQTVAMGICCGAVFILRLLSAYFRWSLPRVRNETPE